LGEAAAAWKLGPSDKKKAEKRKKKTGNEDEEKLKQRRGKLRKLSTGVKLIWRKNWMSGAGCLRMLTMRILTPWGRKLPG
jgi:hypothetical protein